MFQELCAIESLQRLYANGNELTHIPDEISNLRKLVSLISYSIYRCFSDNSHWSRSNITLRLAAMIVALNNIFTYKMYPSDISFLNLCVFVF